MRRMFFSDFWLPLSATVALWAAVGCGGGLGLPPPDDPNTVDTTTLFALRGTPITEPSAYDIVGRQTVRTDRGVPFDLAFDIDPDGTPLIYPAGALGLVPEAGIQEADDPFDLVLKAPTEDYIVDAPFEISVGIVLIARSRNTSSGCLFLGSLPRYGKFRVLDIDEQARTVTLELLVNTNCGFRSLAPGTPTD